MKRKAEDEGNEERKRPYESNDDDMNEVRQGLYLMGFNVDLVDWLLSGDLDIINELNEVRRAVRLYGKGQQQVQSHVTEAVRVNRHGGQDGPDPRPRNGSCHVRRAR